ncbi:MAG: hypothetical protein A3I66_00610 [Burkholderiales bacterium RIFCSPLOWO2_02_FULL_57_36]|nr:MAG: hypothetical protein A3I66_00610 [Burkholderiales bacterium RIFCSPLOWO2_02_FULL_57_36]
MLLTPLPAPPSRADSASFAARADAWNAALVTLQNEFNALGILSVLLGLDNTPIGQATPREASFTTMSAVAPNLGGSASSARYNAANQKISFGIGNLNGFSYLGWNVNSVIGSDVPTYDIAQAAGQVFFDTGTGGYAFKYAAPGTAGAPVAWNTLATLSPTGLAVTGALTATDRGTLGTPGSGISDVLTLHSGAGTMQRFMTSRSFSVTRNWTIGCDLLTEGSFDIIPSTTQGGTTFTTPVARFTSDGNLLVGVTSGATHTINKDAANGFATIINNTSASAPKGLRVQLTNVSGGVGDSFFVGADDGGSYVRYIVQGNGNVVNTNNSYGAISDIKLKENITDATPKLAKLLKVRIVNYNLKTDPTHKQIGVIAQELEEISPGLIEETPDCIDVEVEPARTEVRVTQRQKTELRESVRYETTLVDGQWRKLPITTMEAVPLFEDHPLFDETGMPVMEQVVAEQPEVLDEDGEVITPFKPAEYRQATHRVPIMEAVEEVVEVPAKFERKATGETTKSVKYSIFVPMLIKALQEQQGIIEALAERVTALEAAA